MCYKVQHGLVDIDSFCFVARSFCTSTRGNLFKLVKFPVVSERDENFFFTNRVVNIWNSLPDSIVTYRSVSSSKEAFVVLIFLKFLLVFFVWEAY